jgi:hypothetical protein
MCIFTANEKRSDRAAVSADGLQVESQRRIFLNDFRKPVQRRLPKYQGSFEIE